MELEKSASKAAVVGLSVSLAVAGMVPVLASPPANVKARLAQVRALVADQTVALADADFKQAPEIVDAGFARKS